MKRTAYIGLAMLALAPVITMAQDQTDALRYSQLTFGGTARFMAMGGAFTALGGDASVLAFNPGGLGIFNKSQITFSPGFSMMTNNASFNGTSTTTPDYAVTVQNAAWIASWKNRRDDAMWKSINVGIAYNRTNDFNSSVNIQGNNTTSTLLDAYVNSANGSYPSQLDPFSTAQAYNAGNLIYHFANSDSNSYGNDIRPFLGVNGNAILQQKSIQTTGSMGETDFSVAGNYKNKLYIGATLGIADIVYNENASYTETPLYQDTIFGLQNYNLATTLSTRGAGLNLKIGAIYKITNWLRVGAAVHSPTWFSLTDNYSSFITANYVNTSTLSGGTYIGNQEGPMQGSYNYTLVTPARAMGGVAFVIHHQAIISADYEFVDCSTALLSSADAGAFTEANNAIKQFYMPASNLRVGAELVLYPFSIRAGYTYYGNPYTSEAGNSSIRNTYSAGLGIKINRCFIDLAYVLTQYNENYYLYDQTLVSPALLKNTVSDVVMTFGVNF
jgi:hypothetical protein